MIFPIHTPNVRWPADPGRMRMDPHVLHEKTTPILLFSWQIILCLNPDQKSALKVHQLIQIQEQVVNEIFRDHFLPLEAPHVLL